VPGKVTCNDTVTTQTTEVYIPIRRGSTTTEEEEEQTTEIIGGQTKRIGGFEITVEEKKTCIDSIPKDLPKVEREAIHRIETRTPTQTTTVEKVTEEKTKISTNKPEEPVIHKTVITKETVETTKPEEPVIHKTVITKETVQTTKPEVPTLRKEETILNKKIEELEKKRKEADKKINKDTAKKIVTLVKREVTQKVQQTIKQEEKIINKENKKLEKLIVKESKCKTDECIEKIEIKKDKIKNKILRTEIELDKSKIIVDNVDRLKCKACCCIDHKKALEEVLTRLKSLIPAGTEYSVNVETIEGKEKVNAYLKKHHQKYLTVFKKGGFKKYYNRFHSWREEFFKTEKRAKRYRKAYKYCRSHKTAKYYKMKTRNVRCSKIVKRYALYKKLSKSLKVKCARNRIVITRSRNQRRGMLSQRVRSGRRGLRNQGRRLQSLPTVNQADVKLVETFKSHIGSFKVEDRNLLIKCFA